VKLIDAQYPNEVTAKHHQNISFL